MREKIILFIGGFVFCLTSVLLSAEAKLTKASEAAPSAAVPVVVAKPDRYLFNNMKAGMVTNADVSSENSTAPVPCVIQEIPPEVLINGKSASQLTDAEIKKFIQEKIKNINQKNQEVQLLRIAPGYPVTVTFSEPIRGISIGDEKVLSVKTIAAKELRITALIRPPGDTSLQVVTKNEKRYIYHVFITENFADADLLICINQGWFYHFKKWIPKFIGFGILVLGFFVYKKLKK